MGELIICKQPIAANPFYLEDSAINIYSLEELSYYIANNVYLLNADFISTELCNWIGRELGIRELEKQLLDCIKERNPLHVFVGYILTYCGYLTNQEIRQVLETISSFENKSKAECQKMRADRLMEHHKIVDAIYEYEHMIDDGLLKNATREFEGDVWHNLGAAYARLFFFEEAALCFEEAYMRNRKEASLRLLLACFRCNKNEEGFEKIVEKYYVSDQIVASVKEEVTALSRQDSIQEFDKKIDGMHFMADSREDYNEQIQEILEDWKKDYNRLCRI